jgi:hypothetical protein
MLDNRFGNEGTLVAAVEGKPTKRRTTMAQWSSVCQDLIATRGPEYQERQKEEKLGNISW